VKAELTTVDVYSLKRLIELSNENLNQDQEKKDLLLLIGPTGSGKTTIILKCLGYELEETKIKGLRTLQPKGVRPEHAALRCSPESTSTTRYLFATRLPPDSMPPGDHNNVVHICDTPGFGDTAGV
jgi:energy-coupling factor transporter ATP-binding protein EcfA2